MRVIGKLIVLVSGLIVGLLLTWEMLRINALESTILFQGLAIVYIMYVVGWGLSIFVTKQRLLVVSMLIYIVYFITVVGPLALFFNPSQFTYIVFFMFLLAIGMRLSRQRQLQAEK
jgi:hypothetical protein